MVCLNIEHPDVDHELRSQGFGIKRDQIHAFSILSVRLIGNRRRFVQDLTVHDWNVDDEENEVTKVTLATEY